MDDVIKCIVLLLVAAMLPSLSVSAEQGAMVYIKSSPSADCPADPCYTLSQFATNQSRLQLNTTLLFLSGNHSLDSDIFIADIDHFYMLTYPSTSLSLSIVQCLQNSSISVSNVTTILIHRLEFYGCGDNSISSVDKLTVQNCSFIGSESSGTALNIIHSNADFINCSFLSNRIGTYHGPIWIHQEEPSYDNFTLYAFVGGVMIANQSNISIVGSKFNRNQAGVGGAIYSTLGSQVSITNSTVTENNVCLLQRQKKYSVCFGGVLFCENKHSQVEIINSNFTSNFGMFGGVFTLCDQCTISINSSRFSGNLAIEYPGSGGVLYLQDGVTASIHKSNFFNNSAKSAGGVLNVDKSILKIFDSEFTNTSVRQFGGVILVFNGTLSIDRSYFGNSRAFVGGVLYSFNHCSIAIRDSEFDNNEAISDDDPLDSMGGVIFVMQSSTLNIIHTRFYGNRAHTSGGGALGISSKVEANIVNSSFIANKARAGGAIEIIYQSNAIFSGFNNLTDNVVDSKGGAIYATGDSLLDVKNKLIVMSNNASKSGGGIYLYRSKLNCQVDSTIKLISNHAVGKGGGIFAIYAIIKVFSNRDSSIESAIIFDGNTAAMGGGIHLELATQLLVLKSGNDYTKTIYNLRFIENSADYGGAIYNVDETDYEVCASKSYYSHSGSETTECFLQILVPVQTSRMMYNIVTTEFVNNSAHVSGPNLYGGLLDRCTLIRSAEILFTNNRTLLDGVTYLLDTSTLNDTDGISSSPIQVCLCEPDGAVPNCDLLQMNISVMKGEMFEVSLVVVDQVNRTIPYITVYSSLKYTESGLGEGQMAQVTAKECTAFSFNVFSPNTNEEITLYADGPCRNATKSQRNILVSFLKCTCPIGFQPKTGEHNDSNCICDCDPKLWQYVSNCSSQTGSIVRKGNFWIGYLGTTGINDYNYLTSPHCPLDYCLPPVVKVDINLTKIDGADSQCSNSRSGILCALCKPGHTLSLGGSRCIPCTMHNIYLTEILLISPILGIALIALMLILKLTVDKGTLNGLTFYANIIGANSSIFFPSSFKTKPLQGLYVFISWLNLNIGFDVCFFKGMDTYWKTWIKLAFPAYVILLVIIVIVWSERSKRFANLILRKNPVATLATLILFSYANFLRTVITTLSFVTLAYPEGDKMMWLPDATVAYLQGRHIALFILAILILLVGILYTFLLFAWQWLRAIRGVTETYHLQKLNHFMEVYHAPYRPEHRYWTGLLLLARVVLYLVFVVSNSSLNLLVIIAVSCGLLFLKGHFGMIYQSRMVDTIEMVNYLNIALFSAATFFAIQTSDKYRKEVAYMSVSVTLVLFLFVLAYHIYTELLSKWCRALKLKIRKLLFIRSSNSCTDSDIIQPTSSIIDGLPGASAMPSVLDEVGGLDNANLPAQVSIEKDDDTLSIDSSTPLLQDNTDIIM